MKLTGKLSGNVMHRLVKSFITIAACVAGLAACGGSDSTLGSQTAAQSKQLARSEKAVASSYENSVQALYVAYFGRPADPAGLSNFENALLAANAPTDIPGLSNAYAGNATIQALINNFGNSAESVALYGNNNATTFVNAVFQNLLSRAPQSAGLAFWVNSINSGTLSLGDAALSIMAGALTNTSSQGQLDATLINNRLNVASYFTANVTSANATGVYMGAGAAASARSMLSGVLASTDTTSYQTTASATIASLLHNTQPIIVDSGAPGTVAINQPFTSVTICAPANPSLCQTIDHILVDTGSYGLRVISSVLSSSMSSALSAQTTSSQTLVECTAFLDGYSWGPVRSVNLQIAGEVANNLQTQIIGDPGFSALVPNDCSNVGNSENTVASFGANGVIGVGLFQQDCGSGCTSGPQSGYYYTCSSSSCSNTTVTLAQQVSNPVSSFSVDNNGVIIRLPAVTAGTATASGTMTFGVGTQGNNALGSASIFPMSASNGYFTTIYKGTTLADSFIDSGSNGLYFPDTTITSCSSGGFSGFFCPATPLTLSAVMESTTTSGIIQNSQTITFAISDPSPTFAVSPNDAVYVPLGANTSPSTSFDWGLPFFFGRSVFVVTENETVNGQTGPLMAF